MRDGTQIAVDVMVPLDLPSGTRLPVILIMTRYWRSLELRVPDPPGKALTGPREHLAGYLIPRGFGVVVVDARGTGASTGVSRHPWAPEEIADYGEVVRWAVSQPWCDGSAGAVGISYEGAAALRLPATGALGVGGVVPQEIEFDVYTDVALPGGIFNRAFIQAWSESNRRLDDHRMSVLFPWLARILAKGVRPADSDRKSRTVLGEARRDHRLNTDVFQAMSSIEYRDDHFGQTGATLDDFSVFRHGAGLQASGVPVFSWGSWMDGTSAEAVLRNFNTFDNPQVAVIGAWNHEMTRHGSPYRRPHGQPDPLPEQRWAAIARFFEETLKLDQPPQGKTLFYYTLGEEAWKQTDTFPLPNTKLQAWYFQAEHGLSPEIPPAGDAADPYTVDFRATTGRANRWHTQMARRLVYPDRARADRHLLTYTSAPLERDLEITGHPVVTLHLTSSATDGAFFVYLEDVDTKGVVRYLTEGQLRGIHRKLSTELPPYWSGLPYRTFRRADAAPLPPGEMVEITFGMQPLSVLVRRGHRLRVAVAGADRDTFARVPGQGTPQWRVARNQLLSSHVRLPVVRSG